VAEPLWRSSYNGPADPHALAVSPDGSKVFVTGGSESRSGDRDFATLAHDASSGAKLWRTRFDGPGNGDDYGDALAVSPDGSEVFVTGRSGDPLSSSLYYAIGGLQHALTPPRALSGFSNP
jgi:DNA-binding beta-propeller fold protein YncE